MEMTEAQQIEASKFPTVLVARDHRCRHITTSGTNERVPIHSPRMSPFPRGRMQKKPLSHVSAPRGCHLSFL